MNNLNTTRTIAAGLLGLFLAGCSGSNKEKDQKDMTAFEKGTFGYDLAFLQDKDSLVVLKDSSGQGQLIVSARYQGKVFTSTAAGPEGKSFGWVNYKAFDQPVDPHMNAYGGEDRLWLGPEGGKFSLFFKPGTKMEFDNWHTPPGIDSESWELAAATEKKASLRKDMELQNYAGTPIKLGIERDIEVIEHAGIARLLGISLGSGMQTVGFRTTNVLINKGSNAWDEQTGAPCLWNLDMFSPSPGTVIVIPYEEGAAGKVATTDYFGEIAKDRIAYKNGVLLFKADGKSRGKLGIPPVRVKNVAGSYAADSKVLTITLFDINNKAKYLNQEWRTDREPYSGDAMNAYNDGPLADGSQMGPFYEIESVSPAAFLKPGGRLSHSHSVFHFTGNEKGLDAIARKVLGVSLAEIAETFKK
ncbi:hypothetical protein C7T94_10625 [Pedobacter yulinensis]|uniref:DUF4380 domain-containing protein n=1 Tax=Pedobacter yulinensis TaxID=2126353 RepID=A0A2T3HKT2_9SPHI|nr:DUF6786 family protein [Pedobacter yulinensis]PST83065.1 hypothetical protein C7T94_10625 [Pedobacter yulinensis]